MNNKKNALTDFPYPSFRRVAYAAVVLPSGEMLKHEIVVFTPHGVPVAHFPLMNEQPFVEWSKETFKFPTEDTPQ